MLNGFLVGTRQDSVLGYWEVQILSAFFEIAYAAASNRLCLFTGTGFSKAITSNVAPSWQDLLFQVCDRLSDSARLKASLFPANGQNPVSLEEAAQIIAINLENECKDIKSIIAEIISGVRLSGDNQIIIDFFQSFPLDIVTTNYDKLAEQLADAMNCHSLSPGLPIPRSHARTNVYHVHGSIDYLQNMVVTANDYFDFINGESYFSRKISTLLYEDTVVILGYSLGDNNLKAIISDCNRFSAANFIGKNIFFVSRNTISSYVKDYYSYSYGIRVLDSIEIHDFFKRVAIKIPEAISCSKQSKENIRRALDGSKYTDDYLGVEASFFQIISSIFAIGRSIDDVAIVKIIEDIIAKKYELTQVSGAWVQYEHLAKWLIYIGSLLDVKGAGIESIYLKSVLQSMNTMSKNLTLGYSWRAYSEWSSGWSSITASNRAIISSYIKTNTSYGDALSIVNSC